MKILGVKVTCDFRGPDMATEEMIADMDYLSDRYGKPRSAEEDDRMMAKEDALNAKGWVPGLESWEYNPEMTGSAERETESKSRWKLW